MSRAADLELASVVKRYGDTVAVDRISLKIKAGTYCCLLGPVGLRQNFHAQNDRRSRGRKRRRHHDWQQGGRRHRRRRRAAPP